MISPRTERDHHYGVQPWPPGCHRPDRQPTNEGERVALGRSSVDDSADHLTKSLELAVNVSWPSSESVRYVGMGSPARDERASKRQLPEKRRRTAQFGVATRRYASGLLRDGTLVSGRLQP
jgi:hypothetical protein